MALMWFGTDKYMTWVPAPKMGVDKSKTSWVAAKQYLNGGQSVRRSQTGSRTYTMDWGLKNPLDVDVLYAFAEGAYGNGPLYFHDPMAMNLNVLPHYVANPALMGRDGETGHFGDAPYIFKKGKASKVSVGVLAKGLPQYGLKITLPAGSAGDSSQTLKVPVPPGYTAHIGFYGTGDTSARHIYRTTDAGATKTRITLMSPSATGLTNTTVSGSSAGVMLEIGVRNTSGTGGEFTLYGAVVQILPTGLSVQGDRWITGRGHSGCAFSQDPTENLYSAGLDLQSISATLVEVGAWQ